MLREAFSIVSFCRKKRSLLCYLSRSDCSCLLGLSLVLDDLFPHAPEKEKGKEKGRLKVQEEKETSKSHRALKEERERWEKQKKPWKKERER